MYTITAPGYHMTTQTKDEATALAKLHAKTYGVAVWVTDTNGHCTAYYDGRTSGVHIVATAPRA